MTKNDFMKLIAEGIQEYLNENPPAKPATAKENLLKQSELKQLVKEVVKQVVREARTKGSAGPQYTVQGKKSQVEQPGLVNRAREIGGNPEINEKAIVKNVKENHKVQTGPSYDTVLDQPNDPNNVRDPEIRD